MTIKTQKTRKHPLKPAITALSVIAIYCFTPLAGAQNRQQVSALGRLQPEGGVIRVGAPSTPESISGSILDKLVVKEGDFVKAGELLAVTASAEVLAARVKQAQAAQQTAIRASEAARSQAGAPDRLVQERVLGGSRIGRSQGRPRTVRNALRSPEATEPIRPTFRLLRPGRCSAGNA